jgi:hypothetical protein
MQIATKPAKTANDNRNGTNPLMTGAIEVINELITVKFSIKVLLRGVIFKFYLAKGFTSRDNGFNFFENKK